IPAHPYSVEDIDRYLEGDLSDIELSEFNEELEHNSGLEKDTLLYRETDLAMAETDITELRAALSEIAGRETSTSRKKNDIDHYLQKELSEAELAAFESEMESNPDLVAEVNLYQDVNAAIREEDVMSLRARLEGINNDIINDKRRERSFATRIPRKKAIAVSAAASLTLLLGINGMMNQAGNTDVRELYNKYYSVYPGAGVSRTGGTSLDKDINQALHLFNEKNYDQSILLFSKTLEEDPGNPVANFYTAQAYQETGKYSKAIAYYQLVIQTGNNLFIDQAEWYTGLCYLQNDDRKNAVRKFKTIVAAKSYYSEKASAILRKLRYTEK
ncbi:MAG: tol-pal system YbgF family protein, partial [Mangrovibacterium sp.]